ncbi:MAG: phage major capsid protein, partial [Planctomycetota bacterium]
MSEDKVVKMEDLEGAAAREIERRVKELGLDAPRRPEGIAGAVSTSMSGGTSRGTSGGMSGPAREKSSRFLAAWIEGDHAQVKALSEGSDAAGGYLVPDELRGEVVQRAKEASRLSKLVRRIGCRSNAVQVPTLATDVSVYWGSEGSAFTESDP